MGRNIAIGSAGTSKTAVVAPTNTALTTVYTNVSGAGAELKAVNINGQQNNATLVTAASGASEWSFMGSNIQVLLGIQADSDQGFGEPYPVQLSDNRVLLFFLPHQQHRGGDLDFFSGNMIHTQILEYQNNKYVAGPIQNHTLPVTVFQDMSFSLWSMPQTTVGAVTMGECCWRAVALTANKVVAAVRQRTHFQLMRFTITGNTVDHVVTGLDLTVASAMNTTSALPFALDAVPGNTNQVIVAAADATNWTVQSHNIPDSGALSISSAKQTLWAHNGSTHSIGLTRMVKTATGTTVPYCMAAPTSATVSNGVVYNYDNAAFTWTIRGTNQTLTSVTTNHTGFLGACLSTGTGVNAVICTTTGSGAGTGAVAFYRQLTDAGFSTTRTTLSTQHSTFKRPTEHFQWGDERAIFTGQGGMLVQYDSAGVSTNLISPVTDSVAGDRYRPHWYPFNSRPLYTYYDTSRDPSYNVAYIARTGMSSSVSAGVKTLTGNYLPYGHDYGNGYAWNEQASCWIFAQGGRLYALDKNGVIQSEQNIYNMNITLNHPYCARQVTVTPTGRILFSCDYGLGIIPITTYSVSTQWSSMTAQMLMMVTEPMTEITSLGSLRLQQPPNQISGPVSGNIVYFSSSSGAEMAYMLYVYSGSLSTRITWFNGTAWQGATYTTGQTFVVGTWTKGYRMNYRLIQAAPASSVFENGEWMMMGSLVSNSAANHGQAGQSNQFAFGSFGSMNTVTNTLDSVSVTEGWGIGMWTHNGRSSGVSVAAQYEDTLQTLRVWSSFNGRLQLFRGYVSPTTSVNHRWGNCAVSKFGYVIAYQNTSRAPQTVRAEVWNTINNQNYVAQQTAASGSGWFQISQQDKNNMAIFNTTGANTINNVYGYYGLPDDVRFYIALNNNAGSVFYLNNGQSLSLTNLQSVFRSDVDFQVPAGQSLQVAMDTPFTAQLMFSLLER